MPFSIERNDLARMDVDAVVVAANEKLQITGGVGSDVAEAAGFDLVQAACDEIGRCPTGEAVATPGFGLHADTIVHAVGPIWQGGDQGEEEVLFRTYLNALSCASGAGAQSVALPLISAGTYGFPSRVSFSVAMQAVRAFLDESDDDVDVKLVLFNREAVMAAMSSFGDIVEYIDDHYVEEQAAARYDRVENQLQTAYYDKWVLEEVGEEPEPSAALSGPAPAGPAPAGPPPETFAAPTGSAFPEPSDARPEPARYAAPPAPQAARPLEAGVRPGAPIKPQGPLSRIGEFIDELRERRHAKESDASATGQMTPITVGEAPRDLGAWLAALDAPFSTTLLALIDARGMTDVEVYKRANMSRQLFSKIRGDAGYRPTKKTVLALCVALELDYDETCDLLQRAGFALSNSSKADVIVEYFIVNGIYDIFAINEALYAFDQPTL